MIKRDLIPYIEKQLLILRKKAEVSVKESFVNMVMLAEKKIRQHKNEPVIERIKKILNFWGYEFKYRSPFDIEDNTYPTKYEISVIMKDEETTWESLFHYIEEIDTLVITSILPLDISDKCLASVATMAAFCNHTFVTGNIAIDIMKGKINIKNYMDNVTNNLNKQSVLKLIQINKFLVKRTLPMFQIINQHSNSEANLEEVIEIITKFEYDRTFYHMSNTIQ